MAIVGIQKWQFVSHEQFGDVIRSISLNEQEKNGFSCICQCFRLFPDIALRKLENMLKSHL